MEITDVCGSIKAKYTYDPWGRGIAVEKNLDPNERDIVEMNPLLYRGYVYDSETKLYYLQSRYYDPEVGRFINADDVNYIGITEFGETYNLFIYCENEPVHNKDINGKAPQRVNLTSKRNHYVYVYYYDIGRYGHTDISFDGITVYSYGTYNKKGASPNKAAIKTYVYDKNKGGWFGKYKKVAKISMNDEEYVGLEMYLRLFILLYSKSPAYKNTNGGVFGEIYEYEIIRGPYESYNLFSSNCGTFVRDTLQAVIPDCMKRAKGVWTIVSMLPYAVYKIASKLG